MPPDKNKPEKTKLDRFKLLAEVSIAIGTFVTSTLVIIYNQNAQKEAAQSKAALEALSQQQKQNEFLLQQQAQSLAQMRHLNEYNLNIYKEVVAALKDKNERMERVATALVEAMPEGDPLRESLLNAIAVGATSKEAQDQANFVREQQPVVNPVARTAAAPNSGWDVDIIYCANATNGERRAQLLATALQGAPLAGEKTVGRIRVRKLPESLNKRPAYQVAGLQIRHEAREEQAARNLKAVAFKALDVPEDTIQVRTIQVSTPDYLSFFICPEGPSSTPAVSNNAMQ
ncbi:MAG TPA: hypothetical protein VE153_13955 [Myxococcus sp.]|nr:hypothetical protein [Myxococcus sp.]